MPVKAEVATVTNALVKMENEAIWISGVIVGRFRVDARKPERAKDRMESDKPKIISNNNAETNTLLILATSLSLLYCAENFIMAVVIPQSRNVAIRFGAARAIAYKP